MKRFTYLMFGLSVVFSILLAIGFLLPKQFTVSRTEVLKASPENVYSYLNDITTWEEWTVWSKSKDPSLLITYGDITTGVGASQEWTGDNIGDGKLIFTESVPVEGVWYDLLLQNETFATKGSVTYAVLDANSLKVTWTMTGDLGNNPVLRYLNLGLDKMVGKDFEANLKNLKSKLE